MMYYPIFKFLEGQFVQPMLDVGSVRIATLHEFRDATRYDGTILDPLEGILDIRFFPFSEVDYFTDPQAPKHAAETQRIQSDDCYIYSSTSELFSETLSLRQEGGRTGCVMIWNSDRFAQIVAARLGMVLVGANRCQYVGKTIDEFSDNRQLADIFRTTPEKAIFLKPKAFSAQREHRMVWRPNSRVIGNLEAIIHSLPDLTDLFIPIDLKQLRAYRSGERPGLTIHIHRHDGTSSVMKLREPKELFSPVVFPHPTTQVLMLGFRSESRPLAYEVLDSQNVDVDVVPHNDLGLLFACTELSKIKRVSLGELQ